MLRQLVGGAHGEAARWRLRGVGGGQDTSGEGAPAPQAAQQAGHQEHRGGWLLVHGASDDYSYLLSAR